MIVDNENKRQYKIIDNYIISLNEVIGNGQYGKVFIGYMHNQGPYVKSQHQILAIKESPLPKGFNIQEQEMKYQVALKEINSLRKLHHPNIIKFIDAKKTSSSIYLIMEFCNEGNLDTLLESRTLSESETLYYFREIIDAFRYLRLEKNMLHRDIKPENILIHNGMIKVADFGFAREVQLNQQLVTIAGTPLFADPQIFEGKAYTEKIDIWSLGMTLFYMMYFDKNNKANCFPWYDTSFKLFDKIKNTPLVFPKHKLVSEETKSLIKSMLTVDVEKRITWQELFDHPLLKPVISQEKLKSGGYNDLLINSGVINQSMETSSQSVPEIRNIDVQNENNGTFNQKDLQYAEDYLTRQIQQNSKMKLAQQCIERIDHERNVAQFIYNTHIFFVEQIIPKYPLFPKNLYKKLLYVLIRKSMQFYQLLKQSLDTQQNVFGIEEQQWISFLQIQEMKNRTHQKINSDHKTCEQDFNKYETLVLEIKDQDAQEIIGYNFKQHNDYFEFILRQTFVFFSPALNELKLKLHNNQFLQDQERNLIYFLDNLCMVYTLDSTLQWDPKNKKNFNKFYEERQLTKDPYILSRVMISYQQFKWFQPSKISQQLNGQ